MRWWLVGRLTPTDKQAADLEVIKVKVALDLITPLMVTLDLEPDRTVPSASPELRQFLAS